MTSLGRKHLSSVVKEELPKATSAWFEATLLGTGENIAWTVAFGRRAINEAYIRNVVSDVAVFISSIPTRNHPLRVE